MALLWPCDLQGWASACPIIQVSSDLSAAKNNFEYLFYPGTASIISTYVTKAVGFARMARTSIDIDFQGGYLEGGGFTKSLQIIVHFLPDDACRI